MSVEKTIRKLKEERSKDIVEILEVMPHTPKDKLGLAISMIEEKEKKSETDRTQKVRCCSSESSGLLAKVFRKDAPQKAD